MSASIVHARVGRAALTRRWPTWLGIALVALLIVTGIRTAFADGIVAAAILALPTT
jgi:hypothetical protein